MLGSGSPPPSRKGHLAHFYWGWGGRAASPKWTALKVGENEGVIDGINRKTSHIVHMGPAVMQSTCAVINIATNAA